MSFALDSDPALAVPSRRALGIGRDRRDARLDSVAGVEYGETSSLDSMVERTTARTTREREE